MALLDLFLFVLATRWQCLIRPQLSLFSQARHELANRTCSCGSGTRHGISTLGSEINIDGKVPSKRCPLFGHFHIFKEHPIFVLNTPPRGKQKPKQDGPRLKLALNTGWQLPPRYAGGIPVPFIPHPACSHVVTVWMYRILPLSTRKKWLSGMGFSATDLSRPGKPR